MAAQDKDKAAKKKLQKSYFDVLGLCCSSEIPLIESILKSLDGVKEYSVIVPTKTVIVIHDDLLISQLQIVKALNQARLEANVRVYGNTDYKNKWPSPFAVCSGILVLLSFFKYLYHPFEWLALGAVAVGIIPIFLKVIASLRNFRIDTNVLVLIAVGGTIALKDYTEAGTIVFLFSIAEWLESRASHKANAVMSSLMSMAPVIAVIAETGEQVNVDEIKLNTLLAVKAGEAIPIDGIVVDGKCEVDEKALTGESFPVPKEKDSVVLAGSINLNGYITVKTTAMAEDCVVAKMAKLVEEAHNSKTRTQRFIDKCAQYYIPSVTIISFTLAVIPFAFRLHNKKYWLHLAIVVLVSACPCALILSTPVATFCALTKAATVGLLIKGGSFLEILAKIKVIAFDKTGTITRGEFVVTDFQSVSNDISSNTLLYWVSSIESKSSHPMAAALVDYGRSLGIEPKPENVEEFQNFPGEGIHGKIDGKDIYIGNRKIALRAQSRTVPPLEEDRKRGKTVGYIYCGEEPAGIFCLSDACRAGVEDALKELKRLGIKTAMLTGDCQDAAMYAQQQLNNALEMIHAELLPEDKARIIKEFQQDGSTAMIGDGINDAPALAMADIGIAMGVSGSALATETGNVILMSNDIRKVPKAIKLARKCHRKVKENVFLSISTKVSILALAIAGHPLVWAAVLADVGTCLLVIFNSMTLLRGTEKHGAGKCCKSSSAHQTHNHGSNKHSSNDHNKCCFSNNHIDSENCTSGCQSSHLSMDSCRSNKFIGSTEKQDDGVNKAGHCSHGSCNTVEHDLENNIQHEHGCSGSHNFSSSRKHECRTLLKSEDNCTDSDGAFEVKHCHQECTNTVVHDHFNHSSDLQEHQRSHNPCGRCSKDFGEEPTITDNKPLQNFDSNCCHVYKRPELHNKCCQNGSVSPCVDSEKIKKHACMSLETREIGGCCKSYMKECCKEHGHFSAGIGASLSEIITE